MVCQTLCPAATQSYRLHLQDCWVVGDFTPVTAFFTVKMKLYFKCVKFVHKPIRLGFIGVVLRRNSLGVYLFSLFYLGVYLFS